MEKSLPVANDYTDRAKPVLGKALHAHDIYG